MGTVGSAAASFCRYSIKNCTGKASGTGWTHTDIEDKARSLRVLDERAGQGEVVAVDDFVVGNSAQCFEHLFGSFSSD
jgi:hypothetical protein